MYLLIKKLPALKIIVLIYIYIFNVVKFYFYLYLCCFLTLGEIENSYKRHVDTGMENKLDQKLLYTTIYFRNNEKQQDLEYKSNLTWKKKQEMEKILFDNY